jgi:TolB-like protein/DNA-binding winged helix-turn-helix (wHTH) protein
MSRNKDEISTKSKGQVTLGAFVFDVDLEELRDPQGELVPLRRQSAGVLAVLARSPGQTVGKSALMDQVWGSVAVTDDSLVQCVADIRRTLGPRARICVRTVPRRGYRLDLLAAAPRSMQRLKRMAAAGAALMIVLAAVVSAMLIWREDAAHELPPLAPPDGRSVIAVLPFANMSGDPDRQYFSDGLTEDLTTDLSRFSGMRIISSASSFIYRDSELALAVIARELGATHLIRGSVRRDGRRIRINATLTEAKSGTNVWAERYDRDIGGIFDLQDDVTRSIATALAVQLETGDEGRFEQKRTDPDAYDLLLRGLGPLRRLTAEGNNEARSYLRRALEIDPDYARAHANIALSYGQSIVFRLGDDQADLDIAFREAELAERLDPSIPQTQFALAVVHLALRNHTKAIAAARQSVVLDPSYADGFAVLAQTLAYGGDLDEALAAIRTAKELSPRYTFAYLWVEAHILFQMRLYMDARSILEDVIARNPAFLVGHLTLASTYGHLGLTGEAEWLTAEILTLSPDISARDEAEAAPYLKRKDRAHYLKGLLLAGLPK